MSHFIDDSRNGKKIELIQFKDDICRNLILKSHYDEIKHICEHKHTHTQLFAIELLMLIQHNRTIIVRCQIICTLLFLAHPPSVSLSLLFFLFCSFDHNHIRHFSHDSRMFITYIGYYDSYLTYEWSKEFIISHNISLPLSLCLCVSSSKRAQLRDLNYCPSLLLILPAYSYCVYFFSVLIF